MTDILIFTILEIITKLQEDVQTNLTGLLSFGESWSVYNTLSDKIELWLRDAQVQLKKMEIPSGPRGHIRQFWVSCFLWFIFYFGALYLEIQNIRFDLNQDLYFNLLYIFK